MSRTRDLWQEQHDDAVECFIDGRDTQEVFTKNLQKLGFSHHRILDEIQFAHVERAERDAHEAEDYHYNWGSR